MAVTISASWGHRIELGEGAAGEGDDAQGPAAVGWDGEVGDAVGVPVEDGGEVELAAADGVVGEAGDRLLLAQFAVDQLPDPKGPADVRGLDVGDLDPAVAVEVGRPRRVEPAIGGPDGPGSPARCSMRPSTKW